MPTVCKKDSQVQFEFQQTSNRRVIADFKGGQITSDGGSLLARQVAEHTGIVSDLADCFTDHRQADRVEHRIEQLVSQRVLGIVCGYEDLNDHDSLRDDPLWRLLAGKDNPDEESAAGKSTLNRLEVGVGKGAGEDPNRYHKIGIDEQAAQTLFTDWYIKAHKHDPPNQIILNIDATDDPLHGRQEDRFFHGYDGHYCYLPFIFLQGISCCGPSCVRLALMRQKGARRRWPAATHGKPFQASGWQHPSGMGTFVAENRDRIPLIR